MTTTYDAITGRAASFQDAVRKHARYSLARRWEDLNRRDLFLTTALAVRDSLIDGMIENGIAVSASRCQATLLSVDGISDGPLAREQSLQSRFRDRRRDSPF